MRVALHNASASLPAAEFAALLAGLRTWYVQDFCPAHHFLPDEIVEGDAGDLVVLLVDKDPDPAGTDPEAEAYHTERPDGQQVAAVLVQRILSFGGSILAGPASVSCDVGHEIAEWRLDPAVNLWADDIARECVDPVQDGFYQVGGITVPNFVLPSYFDPRGKPPFDRLGQLSAPLSLSSGGYQIHRDQHGKAARRGAEPPPWRAHRRSNFRLRRSWP